MDGRGESDGRGERDDARPNPLADPAFVAGLRPVPTGDPGEVPAWAASDVHGVRPDGTPVSVALDDVADLGRPVLLLFLSVDCDGCDAFWTGLSGDDPALDEVVPVVVTKGPELLGAADVARRGRGFDGDIVMGGLPWSDYRVTGYPFLVLVDPPTRRILAETVGFGWSDVAAVVRAGLGR